MLCHHRAKSLPHPGKVNIPPGTALQARPGPACFLPLQVHNNLRMWPWWPWWRITARTAGGYTGETQMRTVQSRIWNKGSAIPEIQIMTSSYMHTFRPPNVCPGSLQGWRKWAGQWHPATERVSDRVQGMYSALTGSIQDIFFISSKKNILDKESGTTTWGHLPLVLDTCTQFYCTPGHHSHLFWKSRPRSRMCTCFTPVYSCSLLEHSSLESWHKHCASDRIISVQWALALTVYWHITGPGHLCYIYRYIQCNDIQYPASSLYQSVGAM